MRDFVDFPLLFALVVLLWEAAPFRRRFHDYSTSPRASLDLASFFFVRLWPCFLRGSFLMSQFLDPSTFFLSFVGIEPRSSWVFGFGLLSKTQTGVCAGAQAPGRVEAAAGFKPNRSESKRRGKRPPEQQPVHLVAKKANA